MIFDYLQRLFGKTRPVKQQNPQRGFDADDNLLIDGIYNRCYQSPEQIRFGNVCFFGTGQYYAIFTVAEAMTAVLNLETTMNTYHAKQENCIILDQPLTKVTPQMVTLLFPIDNLKDYIPCLWYDQGLEAVVWETKKKN